MTERSDAPTTLPPARMLGHPAATAPPACYDEATLSVNPRPHLPIEGSHQLLVHSRRIAFLLLAIATPALAQQSSGLNLSPVRPTIANSATIQSPGVLQVEVGYDAYPQHIPGNTQTLDTLTTYTPLPRLRLDFDWAAFAHQQDPTAPASQSISNGVGTIQLGGKVELRKEDFHRPAPGLAVQYEAELPTATATALLGFGQQIILLANHHYGPDGNLDVLVNASLLQTDCQTPTGCSYGGQQAVALSYHLQKSTRLYAEAFAQNRSDSNTPPGTYLFGGFFHSFSDAFGLDGGLRFGVSNHAASLGTTVGLVFGRRLHPAAPPPSLPHP